MGALPSTFLCCLPLWSSLVAACIFTVAEIAMGWLLGSKALIFMSLIVTVSFVLLLTQKDNQCYLKSIFCIYISVGIIQLPLIVLQIVDDKNYDTILSFVQTECDVGRDDCAHEFDRLNCVILVASIFLYLATKTYFSMTLLAFGKKATSAGTIENEEKKPAEPEVPFGIEMGSKESVCTDPPVGVPIDSPDAEKDLKLKSFSSCRHTESRKVMDSNTRLTERRLTE